MLSLVCILVGTHHLLLLGSSFLVTVLRCFVGLQAVDALPGLTALLQVRGGRGRLFLAAGADVARALRLEGGDPAPYEEKVGWWCCRWW